jgi:hypothetical protein
MKKKPFVICWYQNLSYLCKEVNQIGRQKTILIYHYDSTEQKVSFIY